MSAQRWVVGNGMWYHLLCTKMGEETQKAWERKNPSSDFLKSDDLSKFLGIKIRSQASLSSCTKVQKEKPIIIGVEKTPNAFNCFFDSCNERHGLMQYVKFKTASMEDRKDFVEKTSLCFNCLRKKHVINDCYSKSRCKQCDSKHHTSIHETEKIQKY